MPDAKLYLESLVATKEECMEIIEKSMMIQSILTKITEESGIEFPYIYDITDINTLAKNFIDQVSKDIMVFEKKVAEGEKKEEMMEAPESNNSRTLEGMLGI